MADDLQLNVNINVKNAGGGEIKRVASQATQAFKGTAAEQRKGTAAVSAQTSALRRNAATQRAASNAARAGSAAAAVGLDKQKRAAQDAGKALDGTARSGKQAEAIMRQLGRNNMNGLTSGLNRAMQTMRSMVKTASEVGKGIGQIGAGLTAAGMVGARALRNPIDFERNLTSLAITAYGDKDDAEFAAGYEALRQGVNNAARIGGGKREDVVVAANKLVASGIMEPEDIINMLPSIQKTAAASNTSAEDIAGIIVAGVQNGYFSTNTEDIEKALDIAVKGGKLGAAELNNMAASLPMLMAASKGHRGLEGFASLIASFETVMSTSGSADQAATNLNALYSKLTSAEMNRAFREQHGIDLAGSLAHNREQGMSPIDAFLAILDQEVVSKNKSYQALQGRLKGASEEEQRALLEEMGEILQASAIGEVLPDIRASRALAAMLSMREYRDATYDELRNNAAGTVGQDHRRAMQTTSARLDLAATEKDIAQDAMLGDVSGGLNWALDGVTSLAREFPRLTTVVTEAGTAFGMLLAGGAAFSGLGMVFGRGRGGGINRAGTAAGLAGAASGVVPVYVTNMAGGMANAATMGRGAQVMRFMRYGAPLALGMGLFNAASLAMADPSTTNLRENTAAQVGNVGGTMGALGGAGFGAALGTALAPGIGTVLGGVLGGILGNFLGEETMSRLANGQANTLEIVLDNKLNLDGREILSDMNKLVIENMARYGM